MRTSRYNYADEVQVGELREHACLSDARQTALRIGQYCIACTHVPPNQIQNFQIWVCFQSEAKSPKGFRFL
jgi:hypothetical protein